MDWVRRWGRGRIYTTMLGHTWRNEPNPNLQSVGFAALLARGTEWAASGGVTIAPPRPLPSKDRVVLDESIPA
jgi:type 1 glutamine amidotransferase